MGIEFHFAERGPAYRDSELTAAEKALVMRGGRVFVDKSDGTRRKSIQQPGSQAKVSSPTNAPPRTASSSTTVTSASNAERLRIAEATLAAYRRKLG